MSPELLRLVQECGLAEGDADSIASALVARSMAGLDAQCLAAMHVVLALLPGEADDIPERRSGVESGIDHSD